MVLKSCLKNVIGITIAGSMLLTCGGEALAAGDNTLDTQWYIGLGWGETEVDTGVDVGTATLDDDDDGYKIFAGYRVNQYIGLEAFYADLGEASLTGNNGDTFTIDGVAYNFIVNNASVTSEATTMGLEAVATLPMATLTDNKYLGALTPFAKLGFHAWDAEYTATASGVSQTTADDDGTDLCWGLGLNIDVHKHVALRGEFERFDFDGDDVDYLSASIIVKF